MRETADSKKKEVIKLYLEGENTIKDIMRKAGVKSAHTIYKILDDAKVPRLKVRKPVRQITISIDAKLDGFLKKSNPRIFQNGFVIWQKEGIFTSHHKDKCNYHYFILFIQKKDISLQCDKRTEIKKQGKLGSVLKGMVRKRTGQSIRI